jgi:protein-S-isoprenylcysteine O-methyltransferase Ste14
MSSSTISRHPPGPLDSLASPLAAVGRFWRWAESTERGYVYLNKLIPAALFLVLFAVPKVQGLSDGFEHLLAGDASLKRMLGLLYQASGLAFFGLVVTLYLLRKRPLKRVAGPLQGLAALLGSFVMLPVALSGGISDDPRLLFLADLLLILGTAGAALALASLGRCFGIFPEARGLVTHGLYRFVRHPMYLFEFIAFLGVLLPAGTPLNLALYLAFVWLQLARMHFEEQALSAVFPDTYPAYRAATARLVPGVY